MFWRHDNQNLLPNAHLRQYTLPGWNNLTYAYLKFNGLAFITTGIDYISIGKLFIGNFYRNMRKIREKMNFYRGKLRKMDRRGVMTKQNSTFFGEICSVSLLDCLETQGFQIFLLAHLRDVASLFEFINLIF